MSFLRLIILTFGIALPVIGYYVYWAILATRQILTIEQKEEVLRHTKIAYILIALVIAYIPGMLVYFLYTNIIYQFPSLLRLTLVVFIILTIVFEIINYYSYHYYEKKKIIES